LSDAVDPGREALYSLAIRQNHRDLSMMGSERGSRSTLQSQTLILVSCGIAQRPEGRGGRMISQTPKSSTFIGWEDLFQSSALLNASLRECLLLTELADEGCLFGVGCPFSIDDLVIWTDIEAKSLVAAGEVVAASLVEVKEVFPSSETVVALDDGRDMGFEESIAVENDSRIERGGEHG